MVFALENKLYVHTKRGKTSRPFQEDIILFDFANKRELKFRLFKDKDLRISSYHQRIVHESVRINIFDATLTFMARNSMMIARLTPSS